MEKEKKQEQTEDIIEIEKEEEEKEKASEKLEEEVSVEEAEGEVEEVRKAEEAEEAVEEVEEELEREVPARREEIEEAEIVEERLYTIPLRDAWRTPRKHRAPRAIRIIRSFIQRHMKVGLKEELEEEEEEEGGEVIISNEVNEWIWRRGIEKPPRKVRVRAVKDVDGNVTVYLAEGD